MIILPRNEITQTAWIRETWPHLIESRRVVIPKRVVDGLNLIWHSDFVVSGGGTMNREAAALDVPVYSIFKGKIGAVDRYLESNGRLTLLASKEDVKTKIIIHKRETASSRAQQLDSPALEAIMQAIDTVIREPCA
jgi:predicted glycosyltransferase